ncbi:MAG: GGDEF domain-containing protein [Pseudomonadota bacterium]
MNEFSQIFETVNFGLVILNTELKVTHWNHWMARHSGIDADQITGAFLFDFFPELNTPRFLRNSKAVLSFGNFSFFSQKLHHFLFPFKPAGSFKSNFEHMQQNCTMGPIRNDDNFITGIFLIVQDVTELASYEQKLVEMNIKDGLTGIYNRRFLQTRLNEEYQRHKRYGMKLSLIMFDIDFFKKVNDCHGHPCGDAVLQSVTATIAAITRETDCLARYGGEEFCCLLPQTDLAAASILAERFRQLIEALVTPCRENNIKVTISLGVSELAAGDFAEALLKRADEALYQAKNSGRNRVMAMTMAMGSADCSCTER